MCPDREVAGRDDVAEAGFTGNRIGLPDTLLLSCPSDGMVSGDSVGACSVLGAMIELSDTGGAVVCIAALDALSASVCNDERLLRKALSATAKLT